MLKQTFSIPDMHCSNCTMKLESTEDDFPAIRRINASYHKQQMIVEYDETKLSTEEIIAAVKRKGYKGFFGYLFSSSYVEINPMEKISAPKVSKGLPNVLNINEIEAILSQPDTSKKLGLRDKALLETFYASGLRVSELINLKISDLFLSEEMIRVFGKGSKERFVPIGSSAINWISEYLKNSRPLLEKKAKSQHILFLNNRGTKLLRMGVWKIVNNYAKLAGIKKEVHPHTFR